MIVGDCLTMLREEDGVAASLLDLPQDLLSDQLLETLGPTRFRLLAPVCTALQHVAAEKLASWRARATLLSAGIRHPGT